jgi:hypothetical protein
MFEKIVFNSVILFAVSIGFVCGGIDYTRYVIKERIRGETQSYDEEHRDDKVERLVKKSIFAIKYAEEKQRLIGQIGTQAGLFFNGDLVPVLSVAGCGVSKDSVLEDLTVIQLRSVLDGFSLFLMG